MTTNVLNIISLIFAFIGGGAFVSMLVYHKRKHRQEGQLLARLQTKLEKREKDLFFLNQKFESNSIKAASNEIREEIVNQILLQLFKFETRKDYLDAGVTLSVLADRMKTNTTYLSKVINVEKEKKFSDYINELRVDYICEKLAVDKRIRNYSFAALATESGFKTAQKFSDAFYKFKGVRPSVFIKELGDWNEEKRKLEK